MPYPNFVPGEDLSAVELNQMVAAIQAAQARADQAYLLIPGGATSGQYGKVLLSSFSGASDDAKLTNAFSYAAAQTYHPVVILDKGVSGNGFVTFAQTRPTYSGMRISGNAENVGMQNTEIAGSSGAYNPGRVHLTCGSGASSWLVGTQQTYSVAVQDICFTGTASSQFYDHPIVAGTCYAAVFRNLQFSGFKHIFGRPAEPMSCTLVTWEGAWNVTGIADEQISLRGSDNWFVPSTFNIGWNGAPNGKYLIRFSNVAKSFVRGLYLTCRNAGSRAVLVEGPASQQGALFISDSVIEGQNLNEWAAGALIMVLGGGVTFERISMNFGMGNPGVLGDTADIMVTGGQADFMHFDINKASGRSETLPVVRVTGGSADVQRFRGFNSSSAWAQKPLVQAAGGTLTNDASVRTL